MTDYRRAEAHPPAPASALDRARAESTRVFTAVLRGEATAAELAAAFQAEYRLEGWMR